LPDAERWPPAARRAGDAGILIEAGEHAAGLAAAIGTLPLPGVLDVVPGACTVLVTTDGSRDLAELARLILGLTPTAAPAAELPPVEIPVVYDGPDLAEVASLAGLSEDEVAARHLGAQYRVGWLGFAPGFGYLTGLDPALAAVPRLATPRQSVPAGSVAIAGGLAAVYPSASPGGWRLLGRSPVRLFDPARQPPALFTPGRRVRFRLATAAEWADTDPSGSLADVRTEPPGSPDADLEIVRPGPLATVQDLGRPGYAHLGVPSSGAADPASLRRANALAGNPAGAAALELTLGRAVLRWHAAATVAVTGAPLPLALDGQPVPLDAAFAVPAGATLTLGAPTAGVRTYLAVTGGLAVPPVLGSRSADLLSGLGPRPLRPGDRLPVGPAVLPAPDQVPDEATRPGSGDAVVWLRVRPGPRDDWFTAAALRLLTEAVYQVTPASNRTGLRLAGPPLERARPGELPSEGLVTGAIEVPPDGQPILLLADHPATGGYPVIAVIRTADLGAAAQLRPGQQVRFRAP
jgi:KipI family sensor histidine kinase inhibitor